MRILKQTKSDIPFRLPPVIAMIALAAAVATAAGQSASSQQPKAKKQEKQLITSIRGEDLYNAYCASCHGPKGRGDGPSAAGLKTKPADLTKISARNRGVFPTERIREVIAGEANVSAGHGSREMPVWGPFFSQITHDVDLGRVRIDNLARYLEQIQAR